MVIQNVCGPFTFAASYWWEWREKITSQPLKKSDLEKWEKVRFTQPITYSFSIEGNKLTEKCVSGNYLDEKIIVFESMFEQEKDISLFFEHILPRMGFLHWDVLHGKERTFLETRGVFRTIMNKANKYEIEVGSRSIYRKEDGEYICVFYTFDHNFLAFSIYRACISSELTLDVLVSSRRTEEKVKENLNQFFSFYKQCLEKERVRLIVS